MNANNEAHVANFNLFRFVTERIIDLLEDGVIPWRKPWSSAGPPMNADTKRMYSGINLWLLMGLPYESNQYLTFEQIKALGGTVNRGEKGHLVVLWILLEKEGAGKGSGDEREPDTYPFLKYYKVFNTEQCTGLPSYVLESEYERQVNPIAVCEGIVQSMPNAPEIRFRKAKAYYHPTEDYINMPPMKRFNDSEGYYSTLFHEMVHSTGHKSRLDRKGVSEMTEFGSDAYSFEELVAELGSCFLCSHAGIDQKELKNQAAYIKGWLSKLKSDSREILLASSQAQKAVNYILCRNGHISPLAKNHEERA